MCSAQHAPGGSAHALLLGQAYLCWAGGAELRANAFGIAFGVPSVNFTSLFPPVGRLFRRLSPPQRAIFAAALFYYPLLQAFFGVVRGRESRLRRAFCQFHAFVSSRWSSTLGLSYRPVFSSLPLVALASSTPGEACRSLLNKPGRPVPLPGLPAVAHRSAG